MKKDVKIMKECNINICYICGEVTNANNKHITKPYLANDWIWLCDECEKLRQETYKKHPHLKGDVIQYLRVIKGVK